MNKRQQKKYLKNITCGGYETKKLRFQVFKAKPHIKNIREKEQFFQEGKWFIPFPLIEHYKKENNNE